MIEKTMTILAGSTHFAISPGALAVPRGECGLQLTGQGLRGEGIRAILRGEAFDTITSRKVQVGWSCDCRVSEYDR
jgi:hypothetical protein